MRKRLHVALIEASVTHRRKCRQEYQKMDLSEGQPKVLADLYTFEGHLQKDLAELCHVEPATMTVLLRNMGQKGLIVKKAVHVSGGKRAYDICLTDLGREKALESMEVMDVLEKVGYSGFTEEEKDTLIRLLERVADNLATYSS